MPALLTIALLSGLAFAPGAAAIQVPVWAGEGGVVCPEAIAASIDGTPAEIVSVSRPEDDLLLLVVLDLAGDLSAVESARDALVQRIAALPVNKFVGVLQAQNGLRVLAEPSADREATATAIRSLPVGGRAGLLNTIEKAATLGDALIERSRVRLAVLYVTDSDIRNYREAYTNPVVNGSDRGDLSRRFSDVLVRERISRLVTALSATQAPVFITHLSYRSDALNEAYQTGLLTLAQTTGGAVEFSRSLSEIPAAIGHVFDRILNHYSIRLVVPEHAGPQVGVALVGDPETPLTYRSTFTR